MIIEFCAGSMLLHKITSEIDIFNIGDKILIPLAEGKLLFEVKRIMYLVENNTVTKRLNNSKCRFIL